MEKNTVLHTKDGRKIGNAIIIDNEGRFNLVKTDYGSETKLTDEEIEELFYIGFEDLSEEDKLLMIETRGLHKHFKN